MTATLPCIGNRVLVTEEDKQFAKFDAIQKSIIFEGGLSLKSHNRLLGRQAMHHSREQPLTRTALYSDANSRILLFLILYYSMLRLLYL